jgi:hypothetical protein
MTTLMGQSYQVLVVQGLLVDYICVQRCLSIVAVMTSLFGLMVTRLKTGKSTGSLNFEEQPRTPYHRARCEPLYRRVSFCIASALF